MAMLGKRRPPRPVSGHSGLARTPSGRAAKEQTGELSGAPLVVDRKAEVGQPEDGHIAEVQGGVARRAQSFVLVQRDGRGAEETWLPSQRRA